MVRMKDSECIAGIRRDSVMKVLQTHIALCQPTMSTKLILSYLEGYSIQQVSAALRQLAKDGYVLKIKVLLDYEMTDTYITEWKLTEKGKSR